LKAIGEVLGTGMLQIPMSMSMNKKHSHKRRFGDVHMSVPADRVVLVLATDKEGMTALPLQGTIT
jgi:hypothetical protein